MLEGTKGWFDGWYVIHVYGYERIRYLWYSAREAEARYRAQFGLRGRHIKWD